MTNLFQFCIKGLVFMETATFQCVRGGMRFCYVNLINKVPVDGFVHCREIKRLKVKF